MKVSFPSLSGTAFVHLLLVSDMFCSVHSDEKGMQVSTSSRRLKKKKGRNSVKSAKAKSVCLVEAELQSFKGTRDKQYCDTGLTNEEGIYQTKENGVLYINREDAGGSPAVPTTCKVPFSFDDVGPTGDKRGAACIKNECTDNTTPTGCLKQKGAFEYWPQFTQPVSITKLNSFDYSFYIKTCPGASTPASCLGQMYLNIYTESVTNPGCSFFDCRFNVVPNLSNVIPALSSSVINTWINFSVGLDTELSVVPGTGAGCSCPAAITGITAPVTLRKIRAAIATTPGADLNLGLVPALQDGGYAFVINMGDTSASDNGLEVCFDYFQYSIDGQDVVKFDFV